MEKILKMRETLRSLAVSSGAQNELLGATDYSPEPMDTKNMWGKTVRFDTNTLSWVADDASFFTCVRFDSGEIVDDKDVIEDRRFL